MVCAFGLLLAKLLSTREVKNTLNSEYHHMFGISVHQSRPKQTENHSDFSRCRPSISLSVVPIRPLPPCVPTLHGCRPITIRPRDTSALTCPHEPAAPRAHSRRRVGSPSRVTTMSTATSGRRDRRPSCISNGSTRASAGRHSHLRAAD